MKKNAFTLIEVLIAIMLVGIAIASLVGANIAFTQNNGAGTDLSTAEFLIEQIRELTALLPVSEQSPPATWTTFGPEGETLAAYDDVDDFDGSDSQGLTFSPPIDSKRQPLTDFTAFSQQVTVKNVRADNFQIVADDCTTPFIRVTVIVKLNNKEISSAEWIRARY